MSVVVRGMEMPEKCSECKFFRVYNRLYCTAVVGYTTVSKPRERRHTWCPLVDLGKHGRLIDFDALIEKYWDGNSMTITEWDLKDIKAVIEAEGTDEGSN